MEYLIGIVVKVSVLRASDLGLVPAFGMDLFLGGVIPVTPLAACQAPGVRGSALGLVGPVSVYFDWVR